MPREFKCEMTFHFTYEKPTISDQFARTFQQHRPQSKAAITVACPVAPNPVFHLRPGERRRILLHCDMITEHIQQSVSIARLKLAKQQPLCHKN